MSETPEEKIARIDANVKHLLSAIPAVNELRIDSAVNKTQHKWAISLIAFASTPAVYWICHKLGIVLF